MTENGRQQPDGLLAWMESLGDPSRLRMLRMLERQELGVAELGDILQMPQSTISRHLKILAERGWTRSRRVGTTHLSSLNTDELDPTQKKLWQLAREQTAHWSSVKQDDIRLQRRLRERHDESKQFFTGAAAEWDRMRTQLYGVLFGHNALLALLPSDCVVADLGCGTGETLRTIAPYVGRAIGIDNTPAMLQAAGRRLVECANVELLQGELEALPVESECADAAVMVLSLSYVADPVQCVRELARILKPGGRCSIVDITGHDRDDFRVQMGQTRLGFGTDEIQKMLVDQHLKRVQVRLLPPEPNTRGPSLFLASATR
jgi:ubiquinone/menaquinone biosynthesis C-methylase UbiE